MPGKKKHSIFGAGGGCATAFYLARGQDVFSIAVESGGGFVGGYIGGRLPDWVEPALHPGHRSVAHAVIPAGGTLSWMGSKLLSTQMLLREHANRCRSRRKTANDDIESFLWWLAEVALRFMAGAVAGLVVGYTTHLVLDSVTPRGLPILA